MYAGPEDDAKPWVTRFQDLKPVYCTGKLSIDWPELPWETYGGQNKVLSKPEVWKLAPNKIMSALAIKTFDLKVTRDFFEAVKEMGIKYQGKCWFGGMFECLPHHRTKEIPDNSTAFPWRNGTQHHLYVLSTLCYKANRYRMLTATPVSAEDTEIFEEHLEKWKEILLKASGYDRLQQYVNYGNTTTRLDSL